MTTDWRAAQLRLRALGFEPGPIDGLCGPKTKAAITAFGRSRGLSAEPGFGPVIAALMGADAPCPDLPWMAEALRLKGLHERRDTTRLRAWLDPAAGAIDPRAMPWCGAFVASCLRAALPGVILPDTPLAARAWSRFGDPVAPVFGAVLVFWRGAPPAGRAMSAFAAARMRGPITSSAAINPMPSPSPGSPRRACSRRAGPRAYPSPGGRSASPPKASPSPATKPEPTRRPR
ncbi:NlpC/P60 family protein [Rhodobacter capsulatus]|uniref:NlpC/P60 family protein n=1 Tax=Rhodobacter capsulatus TaxID=1061 RepID=UPI004028422D